MQPHTPAPSHALCTRKALGARPQWRTAASLFVASNKHVAAATGDCRGAGKEGEGGNYKRDLARWNVVVASDFDRKFAVMRLYARVRTGEGVAWMSCSVFDLKNANNFKSMRAIRACP